MNPFISMDIACDEMLPGGAGSTSRFLTILRADRRLPPQNGENMANKPMNIK